MCQNQLADYPRKDQMVIPPSVGTTGIKNIFMERKFHLSSSQVASNVRDLNTLDLNSKKLNHDDLPVMWCDVS